MPISYPDEPVIILGMHRSGTSMIARLLKQMGLFIGDDLFDETHSESRYFLGVNDELLKRVHASWDSTKNFDYFLENEDIVAMTAKRVKYDLSPSRMRGFLGKCPSLQSMNTPWGWKDPRTMITAPLWLNVFPKARIVYILRNGIDVASSLQTRAARDFEKQKIRYDMKFRRSRGSRSALESSGYKGSARCLSHHGAFSLWEEYVASAEKTLSKINNEKIILKYEHLLEKPEKHLKELAEFCSISDKNAGEIANGIKSDRANAYLKNPTLKRFYEESKDSKWMKFYNY